jgi:hypothetical protein
MLDLVDLAGSERLRISNAKGPRLEECKHINQSLSALSKVINNLSENPKRKHVSYRDSKLTRILKESLGGNSKTSLIACISPSYDSFSETLSTLHFACKAKLVKNQIVKNCEVRKVVNSRKISRQSKEEGQMRFGFLEAVKEEEGSGRSRRERGQYNDKRLMNYESEHRQDSGRQLDDKHSFGDAQDMKRLEKKLRQIKEKLKICEREREIALNALQQQTEHLNIEKKKRKKLEEEVENLEMMLDLKQSENRTSQTEEGNFRIT